MGVEYKKSLMIFINRLLMKSDNGLKDCHVIRGIHSLKINEECQVVITELYGKYLIMNYKYPFVCSFLK